MALTPTTKLEAVNLILGNIGQSPVASLEVSGFADVAIAKKMLDRISRAVQMSGWHFNTEDDYTLAVNGDSKIPVPSNALQCDPMPTSKYDAVPRGQFLYDRENHTYTFTESVDCRIVFYLDFEELPEPFRYYIAVRAARLFQSEGFGSATLDSFKEEDELRAYAEALASEAEQGDHNILSGSYSVASILRRDEPCLW
jgi:hypothetical protein